MAIPRNRTGPESACCRGMVLPPAMRAHARGERGTMGRSGVTQHVLPPPQEQPSGRLAGSGHITPHAPPWPRNGGTDGHAIPGRGRGEPPAPLHSLPARAATAPYEADVVERCYTILVDGGDDERHADRSAGTSEKSRTARRSPPGSASSDGRAWAAAGAAGCGFSQEPRAASVRARNEGAGDHGGAFGRLPGRPGRVFDDAPMVALVGSNPASWSGAWSSGTSCPCCPHRLQWRSGIGNRSLSRSRSLRIAGCCKRGRRRPAGGVSAALRQGHAAAHSSSTDRD